MPDEIRMMSWNIQSGGVDSYDVATGVPERGDAIQAFIDSQHTDHHVQAVSLVDAFRWDEIYGDDAAIATHLGYQSARFTRLQDDRLDQTGGAAMGIAFATDELIEQTSQLDLGNRLGLGVILNIGRHGLQVANVYLDDTSEDLRISQVRALGASLEKDIPTLLLGDFNALRATMLHAPFRVKALDRAVRSAAQLARSRSGYYARSIKEMDKREVVPLLYSMGYQDADQKARPTMPSRFPVLGLDYVFHQPSVEVSNLEVLPINGASDHRPLVFDVRF